MKKKFVIFVIVAIASVTYFRFFSSRTHGQAIPSSISNPVTATSSALNVSNPILPPSSISDIAGSASDILGSLPTGPTLTLGTSNGNVTVNNFYTADPPDTYDGVLLIKLTQNYLIVYDPSDSSFWLAITGTSFSTWQSVAEQDFLATLGISQSDACKLDVTSGVIYSPGNPNDAMSFPLSFCASGTFGG